MMKAKELAETCRRIAEQEKTCYIWGGCGMPVTERTIADKVAQYPLNRTQGYEAAAKALIGRHAWMFDCVCLIKSVLWGWTGDWSKYYGGAIYGSNGVPDVTADGMIARCREVSPSFSALAQGEALWLPGHIGVYLGGGLAAECTPAFAGGVQLTAVANIGEIPGYPLRAWQKHGKLPGVVYGAPEQRKNGQIIVDGRTHAVDLILKDGSNYVKLRDLAGIVGWSVSNRGATAVIETK